MFSKQITRRMIAPMVMSIATMTAVAQEGAPPPAPQPIESQAIGTPVAVTLKTGEVLRGTFGGIADDKVVIDHPVLGRISIPRAELAGWTATVPGEAAPAPAPATPPADPAKPATPPPPPAPQTFWDGWTGSVELGLNGSEGNSSNLNFRAGFGAERKTEETETKFTFAYSYAKDDGEATESKGQAELRNDWILGKDSPWRVYALGRIEYDEFQAWDWRASAFAGIGYQFFKDEKTTFIGRFGAGASQEYGSEDNRIHPELNLGIDFEHKFTDTQKFTLTLDYYPDLLDLSEYRVVGKAAYEILLDKDNGMTLKVGVEDRYDSSPGDAKRNDLDYFALLVFKF
jgi:putative salt-induced outer membrane protein YdiY